MTFVSKVISEIWNICGHLQPKPISVKNINYLYIIADVSCHIEKIISILDQMKPMIPKDKKINLHYSEGQGDVLPPPQVQLTSCSENM